MRVKFCSHGLPWIEQNRTLVAINPAWLYMQKWYELHGKNPNIQWLPPGLLKLDPIDIIIENIIEENPAVLGLGIYVWNDESQYLIAQKVKKVLPNIIIVCGGPQLAVHKENQEAIIFFKKHTYIDYVVYGDGERPFQQIIDYHSGFLSDKESFVNVIENQQGERKIYP